MRPNSELSAAGAGGHSLPVNLLGVPRPASASGLHLALSLLGVGATLAAAGVVGFSLALRAEPSGAVEACHGFLADHLTIGWALVAGLAAVVAVVLARAFRTLRSHLHAHRQVARVLASLPTATLAGTTVRVLDDARPLAFCGGLLRPFVCVSTGALRLLRLDELRAVVAHEAHHADRRDPLRTLLLSVLTDALFFLPLLRALGERSRTVAELRADAAAVAAAGGDVRALASALVVFEDADPERAQVVEPERVDQLAGVRSRWLPPLAPLLATFGALAAIAGMQLLAVEGTTGAAVAVDALGLQVCLLLLGAGTLASTAALGVTALQRKVQG